MTVKGRRALILAYWQVVTEQTGAPPTLREASEALFIPSISNIRSHLLQLVHQGELFYVKGSARGFRIRPKNSNQRAVPPG